MKNQDMPANPVKTIVENSFGLEEVEYHSETKFEKAFWQVYSSLYSSGNLEQTMSYEFVAGEALKATKAGFKALENNNEQRTI